MTATSWIQSFPIETSKFGTLPWTGDKKVGAIRIYPLNGEQCLIQPVPNSSVIEQWKIANAKNWRHIDTITLPHLIDQNGILIIPKSNGESNLVFIHNVETLSNTCITGNTNELYEFNMNTNELQLQLQLQDYIGYDPEIIKANNNEIHFIDGESHCVFDIKNKTAESLSRPPLENTSCSMVSTFVPSCQSIFILEQDTNKINLFDIIHQKWTQDTYSKNDINIDKWGDIKLVTTEDSKFVLMIKRESIYIYNTQNKMIKQCTIKPPTKDPIHAIMIRNSHLDDCLTIGFIKGCWKEFNSMPLMPQYLMKTIGSWFMIEYLHLIKFHAKQIYDDNTHEHWEINVDILINNT